MPNHRLALRLRRRERAGAVLPLAPGGLQYTDELPGDGPLEVQVYAGADGAFLLVEDDGETTDYATDATGKATRETHFEWDDAARTLSWAVAAGGYDGERVFVSVVVTLFDGATGETSSSDAEKLGDGGSVSF